MGIYLNSIQNTTVGEWTSVDITQGVLSKAGGILSFGIQSSGGDGLVFYSKERNINWPELIVITSYSIHYTKLYDPRRQNGPGGGR